MCGRTRIWKVCLVSLLTSVLEMLVLVLNAPVRLKYSVVACDQLWYASRCVFIQLHTQRVWYMSTTQREAPCRPVLLSASVFCVIGDKVNACVIPYVGEEKDSEQVILDVSAWRSLWSGKILTDAHV